MTTTTAADGAYTFIGAPSLTAGQWYCVSYLNLEDTPGRLLFWNTQFLTAYSAGSNIHISDFDIADIPSLIAPADNVTATLPVTFQWTPRPATSSDSYQLFVGSWADSSLGYVGSYTMNSLPPLLSPGISYYWFIDIYSPDGGDGYSNKYRRVTFSN